MIHAILAHPPAAPVGCGSRGDISCVTERTTPQPLSTGSHHPCCNPLCPLFKQHCVSEWSRPWDEGHGLLALKLGSQALAQRHSRGFPRAGCVAVLYALAAYTARSAGSEATLLGLPLLLTSLHLPFLILTMRVILVLP